MWAGGDGLDGGAAEMRRGRAIANGLRRCLFTCKQGAALRSEPDQGLGRGLLTLGEGAPFPSASRVAAMLKIVEIPQPARRMAQARRC